MAPKTTLQEEFEKIKHSLRDFIELSLKEDEISWSEWMGTISTDIELKCWEEKQCDQKQCPAYGSSCGRCWIIAGTMCGGKVQGKYAKKYTSCKECEFYQKVVYSDPMREIEEHLIVLVHSLRCKQQEVREVSIRDHMTGLFNRRYFDGYVLHESHKVKRSGASLTIMVIDINDFKYVNDTFGHARGDELLKACSQILQSTARSSDTVFRLGGDEFCVIMHGCTAVEHYPQAFIGRIDGKIALWNSLNQMEGYKLSLSYGFSVFTADSNRDIMDCVHEADMKMYEDKKARKKMKAP